MPHPPEEHPALTRFVNRWREAVPPHPPGDGPPRPARRLEVFGVGPDWIQLTWSALGPGAITIRCGDHVTDLATDGGPGSFVIEGLEPAANHTVRVEGDGTLRTAELEAVTLERPPGEELLRVATVNDVHVGSTSTGYFHTIAEVPEPAVPHTVRCLRAAVGELGRWGAQQVVVKGDLVHRSTESNWAIAGAVLAEAGAPVEVVPGNHERSKRGDVEPTAGAAAVGLDLVTGALHLDRGGVRILMADTTRPGTDLGTLEAVRGDLLDAAASHDGPLLLTLHHQPMRFRWPTYLPPGLPGPEARPFLRDLRSANHRVLVTSGHTHRHRRHLIHGVTATEVGSTKDFPGTWAGYHVYESGIVQVVRRISEPSCIRWTDHTRRAAAGVWSWWAPGRLDDRCFTLRW